MERVIVAAVLVALAAAAAFVLRRQGPAPPTQPRWSVPTQLDRRDFEGGDRSWLVAVFTSSACESCRRATAKAAVMASGQVAYDEVPYQGREDLHERYGIDAVPTIVMADAEGVVRASFVGVPSATDLWAALAEARDPGASPEPDLGRPEPS
ncbi:MAG: thioredoxin family protein [Actinomycetota bacterium]|nr:thioredoxin family protein [Actinomycetota bacterium]